MHRFRFNSGDRVKFIDFISEVDTGDVRFERKFIDEVKRFFGLPYYEGIAIFKDGELYDYYVYKYNKGEIEIL